MCICDFIRTELNWFVTARVATHIEWGTQLIWFNSPSRTLQDWARLRASRALNVLGWSYSWDTTEFGLEATNRRNRASVRAMAAETELPSPCLLGRLVYSKTVLSQQLLLIFFYFALLSFQYPVSKLWFLAIDCLMISLLFIASKLSVHMSPLNLGLSHSRKASRVEG